MRTLLGTTLFALLLGVACGEVKPMPTPVEPIRTDNETAPSFEHRVEPPPGETRDAGAEPGDEDESADAGAERAEDDVDAAAPAGSDAAVHAG